MVLNNNHKSILFVIMGCVLSFMYLNSIIIFLFLIVLLIAIIIYANNYIILFYVILLPMYALTAFNDVPIGIPFVNVAANIYQYILLFTSIVYFIYHSNSLKLSYNVIKPILAFIVIITLNVMMSQDVKSSFSYIIINYILLVPYAMVLYCMLLNEKNKNVFDIVLHVTLIIIFLVSLLQFLSNSLLFTEQFRSPDNINELMKFGDKLRIPSLFKHTYALAEFNFYVFPFVLANILNCKTRSKRIYNIIICSSILATTLWSRQRMGLVILLFQFTTMYILAKDIRLDIRSLLNILKLVTIATIVILCVLITEDGQMLFVRTVNTILNPLNDQQDALSLIARIFRINVAWNIFLDYPIWGAGIGTSELLYPEYGWDIKSSSGGPHNLYLFLLAETGLIGFIAFIAGWVHYIKYFWNNIRYNDGNININVLAGFIFTTTILINGMFTGVLYGSSIVFLIIFLVYAYTFLPCNQFNTPINT